MTSTADLDGIFIVPDLNGRASIQIITDIVDIGPWGTEWY